MSCRSTPVCTTQTHYPFRHRLDTRITPASIVLLSSRPSNNSNDPRILQAWLPKTANSKRLATLPRDDRSDGLSKHHQSSHKNFPLANPCHSCNNPTYACKDLLPALSTSAHLGLAYNNQNPQPLRKLRAATTVSLPLVYKPRIQHTSRTLHLPRCPTGADQTRVRPITRTILLPAGHLPEGS